MHIEEQQNDIFNKIAEMIDRTKFAMLTTMEEDGQLRSRPMSTMQMDEDGNLWFFTSQSSPKVAEAQQHRQVNLCYARPDKQDYLSVSGNAELIHDRDKMRSLWTPWIKPWFPNGVDDPDLALLKVHITEAEYWDAPGNVIKRFAGLGKALATGNTDALGEHEKVKR
jgi:general stress protein 26